MEDTGYKTLLMLSFLLLAKSRVTEFGYQELRGGGYGRWRTRGTRRC